jgi:hypothetical protein
MDIRTVFSVDGEGYAITGTGQDAASAIIRTFGNVPKRIFLMGFLINGNFVKADL